jgi:hypothetical protein
MELFLGCPEEGKFLCVVRSNAELSLKIYATCCFSRAECKLLFAPSTCSLAGYMEEMSFPVLRAALNDG